MKAIEIYRKGELVGWIENPKANMCQTYECGGNNDTARAAQFMADLQTAVDSWRDAVAGVVAREERVN